MIISDLVKKRSASLRRLSSDSIFSFDSNAFASLEIQFGKQEIYLYLPEGNAGSKLSNALTEKKVGVNVTARNWNTVLKLGIIAKTGSAKLTPVLPRKRIS